MDRAGRNHYDRVKEFYRTHEIGDYDLAQYYDRAADELTDLFFTGDRSMRESGFDPSRRFGPFSVDIIHYNLVCLNSLLYLMEMETAEIMTLLDRPAEADTWRGRAAARRRRINTLMWDSGDLYYDYDFVSKSLRPYAFLTTFYPLWAGIAEPRHASRIVANLSLFERASGLQTSSRETDCQWDAPFGWAPLQMIAVQGLRRYGYIREADRLSVRFLSMMLRDFEAHGALFEKYDVVRQTSNLSGSLKFGYTSNEIGFGWTNAAFTELYAELSPDEKPNVLKAPDC